MDLFRSFWAVVFKLDNSGWVIPIYTIIYILDIESSKFPELFHVINLKWSIKAKQGVSFCLKKKMNWKR